MEKKPIRSLPFTVHCTHRNIHSEYSLVSRTGSLRSKFTFCVSQFGSQLWFMYRDKLPLRVASRIWGKGDGEQLFMVKNKSLLHSKILGNESNWADPELHKQNINFWWRVWYQTVNQMCISSTRAYYTYWSGTVLHTDLIMFCGDSVLKMSVTEPSGNENFRCILNSKILPFTNNLLTTTNNTLTIH